MMFFAGLGTMGTSITFKTLAVIMGTATIALGFALVGTPPKLFPFIHSFTGLPYIAAALIGSGVGLSGPVALTLSVDMLTKFAGYTHDEASAPMGTLQIASTMLGTLIGPLVL